MIILLISNEIEYKVYFDFRKDKLQQAPLKYAAKALWTLEAGSITPVVALQALYIYCIY